MLFKKSTEELGLKLFALFVFIIACAKTGALEAHKKIKARVRFKKFFIGYFSLHIY
jgi:hypothetical protein